MIKPNKYFTNRTTLCNNEVMSTTQPSRSETQSPWHFELRHRLALTLEVSGMSVQEMADHLGVSANTVGNYTSGRTAPKRPVLVMWAMRTGAPLEWILTGEDPTDPTNAKKGNAPASTNHDHLIHRLEIRDNIVSLDDFRELRARA